MNSFAQLVCDELNTQIPITINLPKEYNVEDFGLLTKILLQSKNLVESNIQLFLDNITAEYMNHCDYIIQIYQNLIFTKTIKKFNLNEYNNLKDIDRYYIDHRHSF